MSSNNRHCVKVNKMKEDELALSTKRSLITNRKIQIGLNIVLASIIVVLVMVIYKKDGEIKRNKNVISTLAHANEALNKVTTSSIPVNIAIEQEAPPSNDMLTMDPIHIIARDGWFANDLYCNVTLDLVHPIENVVISHTATEECLSQAACMVRVRHIQKTDQNEKLCDIKYNFLVGGDGQVYIGRGWDRQGELTKTKNQNTFSIGFIGNFEDKIPNSFQTDVALRLIALGVRLKKLSLHYMIFPEKYFTNNQSPGKELVKIIKKWPNYCNP